jgi:signal peptidase I
MNVKNFLKWLWWFIWEDDSWASWLVNIVLAFIIVKFIIYPGLGFLLGTDLPIVAVVSGSMEHNGLGFDEWWDANNAWYRDNGILKEDMKSYRFKNGFNKGDIIVLTGVKPDKLKKGTVVVYATKRYKYPIIHRVVNSWNVDGKYYFETKGDNNHQQDPEPVSETQLLGKAWFKIPYLGWIKLIFTKLIGGN